MLRPAEAWIDVPAMRVLAIPLTALLQPDAWRAFDAEGKAVDWNNPATAGPAVRFERVTDGACFRPVGDFHGVTVMSTTVLSLLVIPWDAPDPRLPVEIAEQVAVLTKTRFHPHDVLVIRGDVERSTVEGLTKEMQRLLPSWPGGVLFLGDREIDQLDPEAQDRLADELAKLKAKRKARR